jgi:predicted MFS family arabinose efflux permease
MSSSSERNYRLSVAYSIALNTPLYWPYMFHYTTEVVGLSASEFGLLKGIYYFTVVSSEIPFGVVADRLSRRMVLFLGAICTALGCALYGVGSGFAVLAAGEIVFGFGTALASGATSALLYDSLYNDGRTQLYPKLEGRVRAGALVAMTLGLPLTDLWLIRDGDPVLSYYASLVITACGAAAALAMREPDRGPIQRASTIGRDALREVVTSRSILQIILFGTGVGLMLRAANALVFNPVLEASGVPVDRWGMTLAGIGLVGAVCAWRAHAALSRFGDRRVAIALVTVSVAMYLALATSRGPAVVAILCLNGVSVGVIGVLTASRLNRLISSSSRRATVLSVQSMAERAGFGLAAIAVTSLLERCELSTAVYGALALGCLPIAAAALVRPAKSG